MHLRDLLPAVLLLLSVSCALLLGFFAFDSETAVALIKRAGYWVMLANFTWLVINLIKRASRVAEVRVRLGGWIGPLLFISAVSVVLFALQPTGYKIIMDEPVLSATALRMHEYKEVMTTARAHDLQGVFTQLDGYVDKRPYFYPFLVSLLHDFTGYRSSNTFLLNALLTPVFLGLLFICGRWAWPRYGGYCAVMLFATVPLLAMNVNGGGFELLNLVMILAAVVAAKSYVEAPSLRRVDTLILVGLLLAQTRYESVLYVLAVAAVGLVGWFKVRTLLISTVTIVAPLLLIPFALQQVIFSDYQGLWQLKDGAEKPFLLRLIPENLEHAATFFFNFTDDQQPNSLLLSVLFVAALVVTLVLGSRWIRNANFSGSKLLAVLPFFAVILFNFALLMAYHWGQLDDIIATRIVLPFILFQVLFVVFFIGRLPQSRALHSVVMVVVLGYFMAVTVPLCARSDFLRWVPVQHEVLWLQQEVQEHEGTSALFITNKHLVALVERRPAISQVQAMLRKGQLDLHLRLGSYQEILFVYPSTVDSKRVRELKLAAGDLEANFELDLIKQEKLGKERYMCISRLKAVKWLEGEVREFELEDLSLLDDADTKLRFYARTLP